MQNFVLYIITAIQTEPWWWKALAFLATLVFGTLTIVRSWINIATYRSQKQKRQIEYQSERSSLINSFQDTDIETAQSDFITPYCSNIDPSIQDDLRNTVGVRQNVFEALWNELNSSDKRHILVLADSGMGKTTLLLNIWGQEQKKSPKKRKRIALIPLGQENAIEQIKKISDQRNTILFLDALDEDTRAIENLTQRLTEIQEAASNFKSVVMTCRTQFFQSDNDIPRETGIKRVSARKAGIPTFYQWITVYLQPFDSNQINKFIKSSIPWYKPSQRQKARKIVNEIADLAARPMLAALIPELAASNLKVHGLWDLYVFMVDSWVKRESSWIDPDTLKRLSKILAVDLVLNRSTRNSERVSLPQLLEALSLSNQDVDSWKLTGRSLLNRDADGHYKFAHRSIMEFLFIQALVEGDNRCLTVGWTDMMRQLFLSWGRSENHDINRANQILKSDLRLTKLFPLDKRHIEASNIDAVWVKKILSELTTHGANTRFPPQWRASVSHINETEDRARIYDFAEGLIWQIYKTNQISDRDERDIYKVDRNTRRDGDSWVIPDLLELCQLIEILASLQKIEQLIDERELYWIIDTDGKFHSVTRIRLDINSEVVTYPNLTFVHSAIMNGILLCAIDVYKADLRKTNNSTLLALPILTFRGNAEEAWRHDKGVQQPAEWSTPSMLLQGSISVPESYK